MVNFLSLLVLVSLLLLHTHATADMATVASALQRGDYDTAVAELTRMAEQGNPAAQSHLGYLYHTGEGVEKDPARAAELYHLAAVQGNRDAQYNLAVAYAFGEGVEKDLAESVTWYRRAGEQDHLISQYSLGISYAYGEGIQQDYTAAARWFRMAADKGYGPAQVHLASLYHTGEGVAQDYTEAAKWYQLAAAQDDATAQYNLGLLYRGGKGVDKDLAEARRWLQRAADQGYLAAQNELASFDRAAMAPTLPGATVQEANAATKQQSGGFFSRLGQIFSGKDTTADAPVAKASSAGEAVSSTAAPKPAIAEQVPVTEAAATKAAVARSDEPARPVEAADPAEAVAAAEAPLPAPAQVTVEESIVTDVVIPEPDIAKPEPAVVAVQEAPITKTQADIEAAALPAVAELETARPEDIVVEEDVVYDVVLPEPVQAVMAEPTILVEDEVVVETEALVVVDDEIKQTIAQVEADSAEPATLLRPDERLVSTTKSTDTATQPDTKAEPMADTESVDTEKYSIDKGRRALLDKNYEQALYHFEPLAKAGNTEAQSALGNMYYSGTGVKQDYSESFLWYHLAAAQGNRNAQYLVGNMYLLGEGVNQDNDQAAYWYEKSSAQGHIAARQNLQSLQELQALNRQNANRQETLIAEQTPSPALAESSSQQPEVEVVDLATGIEATATAAVTARSTAQPTAARSGGFFASLFGPDNPADAVPAVTAEPAVTAPAANQVTVTTETPAASDGKQQQVEVDDKSIALEAVTADDSLNTLITLANRGDSNAQYQLATRYYAGSTVDQDYNEAARWYRLAADQNNMDAQYSLGNMYLLGEGVKQNNTAAAQWYARAAKLGHASAQNNLDSLRIDKTTLPEQPAAVAVVEASTTAKPASVEPENTPAPDGPRDDARLLYELGLAHSFGDGVKQDHLAAFNYFVASASKGYAPAQYKTGIAYAYGEGVKQDYIKAAEWYGKAAEQGHMIAQRNLATMYLNGSGIKQDRVKALAWYRVIASNGNAMDVRRRDMLQQEMSKPELAAAKELAGQIAQRVSSKTSL